MWKSLNLFRSTEFSQKIHLGFSTGWNGKTWTNFWANPSVRAGKGGECGHPLLAWQASGLRNRQWEGEGFGVMMTFSAIKTILKNRGRGDLWETEIINEAWNTPYSKSHSSSGACILVGQSEAERPRTSCLHNLCLGFLLKAQVLTKTYKAPQEPLPTTPPTPPHLAPLPWSQTQLLPCWSSTNQEDPCQGLCAAPFLT